MSKHEKVEAEEVQEVVEAEPTVEIDVFENLQPENILLDYLPESTFVMKEQLMDDFARWGEEWRKRDIGGQDKRIADRLKAYIHAFENHGEPLPYGKIMGLAHIAIVRINHPELLEG